MDVHIVKKENIKQSINPQSISKNTQKAFEIEEILLDAIKYLKASSEKK